MVGYLYEWLDHRRMFLCVSVQVSHHPYHYYIIKHFFLLFFLCFFSSNANRSCSILRYLLMPFLWNQSRTKRYTSPIKYWFNAFFMSKLPQIFIFDRCTACSMWRIWNYYWLGWQRMGLGAITTTTKIVCHRDYKYLCL